MKRLLDKTWAKLTAFFLTLLFGTMTVLGGLGVGILVSYDVFLDGGAYMRETMYESQCSSAIHNAYYYLRGTMANAGLLADDTPSTDTSSAPTTGGITDEEQQQVLAFIQTLDIRAIATEVMEKLFAMLEMKFDFKLPSKEEKEETK